VIKRRFGVSYTSRGVSYLLHRIGYSQQGPDPPGNRTRPGGNRELASPAVAVGKEVSGGAVRVDLLPQDEADQVLRSVAKTWTRRGHTPVVEVLGKGTGRVSIAGLVCLKLGHRAASITSPAWSTPATCLPATDRSPRQHRHKPRSRAAMTPQTSASNLCSQGHRIRIHEATLHGHRVSGP
jgi:hypothetical protein